METKTREEIGYDNTNMNDKDWNKYKNEKWVKVNSLIPRLENVKSMKDLAKILTELSQSKDKEV